MACETKQDVLLNRIIVDSCAKVVGHYEIGLDARWEKIAQNKNVVT